MLVSADLQSAAVLVTIADLQSAKRTGAERKSTHKNGKIMPQNGRNA